jgi:hypothetical protein
MYHAVRASVFTYYIGDDYQEHRELPLHIPPDFDPGGQWEQIMKNARLTRNRADYDPYPISNEAWRRDALALRTEALRLLKISRAYLKGKGCYI